MTCLELVSRLVAACFCVLWLPTITARLEADAFATGERQRFWSDGCLRVGAVAGGSSLVKEGRDRHHRITPTAPWPVSCSNTKKLSMQLCAEGDTGGTNGGQILLAERSVNRVTLIGRVGLDPEIRHLPSGDRMASFSLATSEQWRDKVTGEVRCRTEWHRIVVFDKGLVDLVEAFVHKGRRLYVDGPLQTRRWVASDGQERYTTEILLSKYKGELVLLESPEDKHGGASTSRASSTEIPASGETTRLGGTDKGMRSGGVSSGTFGSQKLASNEESRNVISAHGNANAVIRPHDPWR